MLLVTKASVTMPCETHVLVKIENSRGRLHLPVKGKNFILCYIGFSVDATKWRLSQAGKTSSPLVFSVVEMGSVPQMYAATGLNRPEK